MSAPDWDRMIDAHAAKGIPARPRTPEAVAARQATYETAPALPAITALTFNADRAAEAHLIEMNRGRRALAETITSLSRDITNGVVEEHLGLRPARHRKEIQS